MRVAIVAFTYKPHDPHPVYVEMARRLEKFGVELWVDNAWSDTYATADLIIGDDPISDRETLSNVRIVGQRTLNRRERMEIAQSMGSPVARFGSPRNEEELTALGNLWGSQKVVLKYDWSSRRNGVFLWPLSEGRRPIPGDFRPESDLFMEFLDGDPQTYKMDVFGGTVLGGWILPTRDMRNPDWQVIEDPGAYEFEPPPDVSESLTAVSRALLRYGVGYASFDLMKAPRGFRIIEINTCSVGTSVWDDWPDRYATNYSKAILENLGRLDAIPVYGNLRKRGEAAGNDRAAPALKQRVPVGQDSNENASVGSAENQSPQKPKAEVLFYRSLGLTEFMSGPDLVQFSRSGLTALLKHSSKTVPFYGERLARLFSARDQIDWERWPELPFTTREDIRERRQWLLSRDLPPVHGSVSFTRTSGSTDSPVALSQSRMAVAAQTCIQARHYAWHGMQAAEAMATTMPGPARARWAPSWLPPPHGLLHRCDAATPEEQLEWLPGLGPIYLRTMPSQLRAMARAVKRQPHLKPNLKGILTYGESLSDDARRLSQKYLGCDPWDAYGMAETGLLALQCPASRTYHLQSEVCLIEILNDAGEVCGPGEIGEIVVTPIYNFAMPLIRYRTGDFAEVSEPLPCSCGRSLPRIKRILGRRQNLLQFLGGASGQPDLDSEVLWGLIGVSEWQLVQTSVLEVVLRYSSHTGKSPIDLAGLQKYIRSKISERVSIKIEPSQPDTLRLPSGKLENYICQTSSENA